MAPSHKFFTDLSDDMAELLNTGAGYDVVIQVGEEPNVKEFRTHSVMLAARCPYFQTALSSKWAKKQGDIFIFRKPNISPKTFKEILLYLYTGTIDLVQQDGTDLIKILVAADELDLQKIVLVIKEYLIDNQSELLIRNPIRFVQSVFHYEICTSLRDYCLQAICENPQIIFGSSDYLSLDKPLLLRLLNCDKLEMDEIDIWQNTLKWGIAQNSLKIKLDERNPAKNLLQWTDKDFIALSETLQDLIPLIRWIHIPSSDFLHKVRPFKKLLPQTLYEDILSFHLDSGNKPFSIETPPRKGPIFDSVLMDYQHVCALANFKIARVQRPQYAIYYDRKYGPGWGYSGDLIIKDAGSIYNSQKTMTYPEASKFFQYTASSEYDIDEYEVFQVIRKPGFREMSRARYYSRGFIRMLKRQNWNYFFKLLIMLMFTLFIGWMIIKYEIYWKVYDILEWIIANFYKSMNNTAKKKKAKGSNQLNIYYRCYDIISD
ncbi:7305_t:CDS:2 [Scutellospora calospora]|uniref:7305_t:CDS:1 n=1 Tax=Scutellospora calospora TaxID=85575 RepID=A0ACA9K4X9_9GLOM|nr:7305_t:CDS:2 [Scutellospora calospora]